MNTLFVTLKAMGFTSCRNGMVWGCGSFGSAGTWLAVAHVGKGYSVSFHTWEYNCFGDCIADERAERWFRRHSDVVAYVAELRQK